MNSLRLRTIFVVVNLLQFFYGFLYMSAYYSLHYFFESFYFFHFL